MNIYEQGLDKTAANFVALSPTSFVERSAEVFGDLPRRSIHGQPPLHLARDCAIARRGCAAALRALGVARGTTVSVMLPQHARDGRGALRGAGPERGPQHAQHAPRRRAASPGSSNHCECEVLITDRELAPTIGAGASHPALRRTAAGRS